MEVLTYTVCTLVANIYTPSRFFNFFFRANLLITSRTYF